MGREGGQRFWVGHTSDPLLGEFLTHTSLCGTKRHADMAQTDASEAQQLPEKKIKKNKW